MTVNNINVTEAMKDVDKMLRTDRTMSPQVRAMMKLLVVVINLLLGKLGLNSSNSSIPPSKDTMRQRGSKRKTSGKKRKSGGQKGHKGTNLKWEENPDKVKELKVDRRRIPKGKYTEAGYESRQVINVEITKHVTEYRAQVLQDEDGNKYVADFPPGVTRPVQYGNSVKAQSVYMSQQQLVPYDRVRDYFADQCGIPISTGSLFNFNRQAFELLEEYESIAKRRLIERPLLHADETGINNNGKLFWLHSVSDEKWTMFFPHEKRGGKAIKDMGVLEHFRGILCHDHWKPYFQLDCTHALCNAHHLRELEFAVENDGYRWAKKMQNLLLEIDAATTKAGGCLPQRVAKKFRSRYRNILTRGDKECPPPKPKKTKGKRGRQARTKSRNLLERLRAYEEETLRFMTEKLVPFTNNQGENDIRMTKVHQKISGCFRSIEGAQIFCRIRGYLSTCSKHEISATTALQMLFDGKLPEFVLEK